MEVRFELTRDDFWAFNRHVLLHVNPFRRNVILNAVGTYLTATLVGVWLGEGVGAALAMGLAAGSAGLAAWWLASKRQAVGMLSGRPGVLGQRTLSVTPEGIHQRTRAFEELTRWPGIQRIVEDREHIYFFVETHMAHIVPKRTFPSEGEAARFLAEVTRLWRDRRGADPGRGEAGVPTPRDSAG